MGPDIIVFQQVGLPMTCPLEGRRGPSGSEDGAGGFGAWGSCFGELADEAKEVEVCGSIWCNIIDRK